MPHDTALIFTLAGAFGLAFLMGLGAVRLKLPPLVGYLFAGVIIGRFVPSAADAGLAAQLAEVGVILLMFGVGLHFSIGDLLAVKRVAVPGALIRIVIITAITGAVTTFWGWSLGAGVVTGLALAVASTVVVLRAFDELGLLQSTDGRVAVGWLVVEDLAMVLALVLLPPIAPSLGGVTPAGFELSGGMATQLALTLVKVAAFVVLMLFVGTRAVPWMLVRVARTGSRELFTLAVLAVALGIAVGAASLFGVSFALGAFFAGVVIAESDLSHQAAADALPLQDAFAVLFFVSVGMLFDPLVLAREPLRVLTVLALVILVKAVVTFVIVRGFGRPVRSSLLISASLAQIGEFSFILAGLGITLGLLPEEARSLILAGAILSITINPLVIRGAAALERWLHTRPALLARLEPRQPAMDAEHGLGALSDHVVLIGYGRVGRRIGDALTDARIPYMVVERDRVTVEALRKRGVPSIFGDAARPGILDHCHLDGARMLVVASPDPYHTQRVVEIAKHINPSIDIAARTHSEKMEGFFGKLGVQRAFMGERELALSMAHYTLMRMGRTDDEADETIEHMRRKTSLAIRAVKL